MKEKFGSIFGFDNEVFPLSLWVVVKPSIEELKETFDILEEDGVTVSPLTDDRIKEYWSACRITVVHKKTRETGSLIAILIPSKVTMGTITHEVSHAYDDHVQLLNLEPTGETRAYLSEWMADKVYGVMKKENLMIVEYGTQCPAHDCWTCGTDRYGIDHCNYCEGCKAHLAVGVECGYSPKPNCAPKFKVGQKVYRFFHLDSYDQAVIRKVEWDGKFQWEYTFQRERTPHSENRVFATRQEIDTYVIEKHARRLLDELQKYAEEYHIPLENLKQKMIEQK